MVPVTQKQEPVIDFHIHVHSMYSIVYVVSSIGACWRWWWGLWCTPRKLLLSDSFGCPTVGFTGSERETQHRFKSGTNTKSFGLRRFHWQMALSGGEITTKNTNSEARDDDNYIWIEKSSNFFVPRCFEDTSSRRHLLVSHKFKFCDLRQCYDICVDTDSSGTLRFSNLRNS